MNHNIPKKKKTHCDLAPPLKANYSERLELFRRAKSLTLLDKQIRSAFSNCCKFGLPFQAFFSRQNFSQLGKEKKVLPFLFRSKLCSTFLLLLEMVGKWLDDDLLTPYFR